MRMIKHRLLGTRSLVLKTALYRGYTDDYAGPGTDSHSDEFFEAEKAPTDTSWATLGETLAKLGVDYHRVPSPSGMEDMVLYCVYDGDDPYGADDGIITETEDEVYFSDGLSQYGVPRDTPDLEQRILDYANACKEATARKMSNCTRVSTAMLRLGLTRKGGKRRWRSVSLSAKARTPFLRASSRT